MLGGENREEGGLEEGGVCSPPGITLKSAEGALDGLDGGVNSPVVTLGIMVGAYSAEIGSSGSGSFFFGPGFSRRLVTIVSPSWKLSAEGEESSWDEEEPSSESFF